MARQTDEALPLRADRVQDGIYWGNVYFVIGRPSETSKDNEVDSPPWAGEGDLFVLDRGGKSVTLFAPYQLESHQVTRHSYEYRGIQPARSDFERGKAVSAILAGWELASRYSLARDFDTGAMILRALGEPVPTRTLPEGVEQKPSGGKEADVLGLLKPVKRNGRRGQVLAFFLPGARSVREAMAEFGVTRSNLLSQLYLLQKEHGIGYVLQGDAAVLQLPAGCTDPFEPEETKQ